MWYHIDRSPTFSTTRSEEGLVTSAMLKGPRDCLRAPELKIDQNIWIFKIVLINVLFRLVFKKKITKNEWNNGNLISIYSKNYWTK